MNRPFLRTLAVALGFSVHERSSHGPGKAWDWGPKHTMLSNHFKSEALAWADLEETMQRKCEEAERIRRTSIEINREGSTHAAEPLTPEEVQAAVARWIGPEVRG